ncbi:MAG: protein TolR [Betaproteobacteria bacterium HGW-Betaproteobacteria-10]|nr:MAG: protein TolR [Betaproteobacteria bacterium HGW-Betaproteobacteria-10]
MRQRRLKNEINVVPYIDVMLVLLVIFMVTTPMMTGSVDLPSTASAPAKPPKYVKIQVENDGALSVFDANGKQKKIKDIKELKVELASLKASDEATPVLIAGDKETQYKNIIDVLDEVKRSGFQKVALETGSQ